MPIGFFQIDNLLVQRINFSLFSTVDLSALPYKGLEKMHLEKITTPVDPSVSLADFGVMVQEKGLDKAAPIIIVCEDGAWSKTAVDHLFTLGYINAFYALGGRAELLLGA